MAASCNIDQTDTQPHLTERSTPAAMSDDITHQAQENFGLQDSTAGSTEPRHVQQTLTNYDGEDTPQLPQDMDIAEPTAGSQVPGRNGITNEPTAGSIPTGEPDDIPGENDVPGGEDWMIE